MGLRAKGGGRNAIFADPRVSLVLELLLTSPGLHQYKRLALLGTIFFTKNSSVCLFVCFTLAEFLPEGSCVEDGQISLGCSEVYQLAKRLVAAQQPRSMLSSSSCLTVQITTWAFRVTHC